MSIAKQIVEKNPKLKALVQDNAGENYQLVKQALRPAIRTISEKLNGGKYVSLHRLTWDIINYVEGEEETLDLDI